MVTQAQGPDTGQQRCQTGMSGTVPAAPWPSTPEIRPLTSSSGLVSSWKDLYGIATALPQDSE